MVDILHREIELVFVMLGIAAIFRAAENTAEAYLLSSKKGTTRWVKRSAAVIGVFRS
jgi:hypothetical protein